MLSSCSHPGICTLPCLAFPFFTNAGSVKQGSLEIEKGFLLNDPKISAKAELLQL